MRDAREVVQIMKASMIDTYSDENGLLDFSRLQHGAGMSRASEVGLDAKFDERRNVARFAHLGEENDACRSTSDRTKEQCDVFHP